MTLIDQVEKEERPPLGEGTSDFFPSWPPRALREDYSGGDAPAPVRGSGSDLAKDPSSGPPEEPLIDQVHLGGPGAAGEAAE